MPYETVCAFEVAPSLPAVRSRALRSVPITWIRYRGKEELAPGLLFGNQAAPWLPGTLSTPEARQCSCPFTILHLAPGLRGSVRVPTEGLTLRSRQRLQGQLSEDSQQIDAR